MSQAGALEVQFSKSEVNRYKGQPRKAGLGCARSAWGSSGAASPRSARTGHGLRPCHPVSCLTTRGYACCGSGKRRVLREETLAAAGREEGRFIRAQGRHRTSL